MRMLIPSPSEGGGGGGGARWMRPHPPFSQVKTLIYIYLLASQPKNRTLFSLLEGKETNERKSNLNLKKLHVWNVGNSENF